MCLTEFSSKAVVPRMLVFRNGAFRVKNDLEDQAFTMGFKLYKKRSEISVACPCSLSSHGEMGM